MLAYNKQKLALTGVDSDIVIIIVIVLGVNRPLDVLLCVIWFSWIVLCRTSPFFFDLGVLGVNVLCLILSMYLWSVIMYCFSAQSYICVFIVLWDRSTYSNIFLIISNSFFQEEKCVWEKLGISILKSDINKALILWINFCRLSF